MPSFKSIGCIFQELGGRAFFISTRLFDKQHHAEIANNLAKAKQYPEIELLIKMPKKASVSVLIRLHD